MPPAAHPAPTPHAAAAPAPLPAPAPAPQQAQQQMPPIPQLPSLPKEAAPPVAVVGVLSVPEVMQKSVAAQGVQQVIQQRQADWHATPRRPAPRSRRKQAHIIAERASLTDAQLEARSRRCSNEIAATQTRFQERNQAIQNSGQAALQQIEAELIAIIRQEAEGAWHEPGAASRAGGAERHCLRYHR